MHRSDQTESSASHSRITGKSPLRYMTSLEPIVCLSGIFRLLVINLSYPREATTKVIVVLLNK